MSQNENRKVTFPEEEELRNRLGSQVDAIEVPIRSRPESKSSHCYQNVKRQIAQSGGTMICGWKINEVQGLYVEAEYHAIWQSLNGELVDVTPNYNDTNRAIFIPDYSASEPKERVLPIQVAILKHQKMEEFFRLQSELQALRADQLGIRLLGGIIETPRMRWLEDRSDEIATELRALRGY